MPKKKFSIQFVETVEKEEFEQFYNSHTVKEIIDYYNITSYDVFLEIRRLYNITSSPKMDRSNNHTNKGKRWITNGIEEKLIEANDPIESGYRLGKLPFKQTSKDKISKKNTGKVAHNRGKICYTDGTVNYYANSEEKVPENFYRGCSGIAGKSSWHNKEGNVIYLTENELPPEGYTKGTGKDTSKGSVEARSVNIKSFEKESNRVLFSTLATKYDNKWSFDNDFISTLDIVVYKGYRFVSILDIPKIQNFVWKRKDIKETILKTVNEYESNNNVTNLNKLVRKYGQLGIFKNLPKIYYKGYYYISNEKLPEIESYAEESRKHGHDGTSFVEKEILAYIKSIYSGTILENNRKTIMNPDSSHGWEIDILLPDKKLGVEVNGVYWHSSLVNTPKNYHELKSKLADEQEIRLIHIYDSEWYAKKEKIQQLLNIAINSANITKVYARNCYIKEITNKEAQPFNDQTHLQGHRNAKVTLGLFTKNTNELVQLMSFSKTSNARSNGAEWEIIRGCPGSNNIVVGGVSKLFNYFVKTYDPRSIFSYCDFNKFNGSSYVSLGMEFIGYTGPDKYWVVNGTLLPRNPNRYKELKNKAEGVLWGAGSKKYLWKKTGGGVE